jgi:hypothetical protein
MDETMGLGARRFSSTRRIFTASGKRAQSRCRTRPTRPLSSAELMVGCHRSSIFRVHGSVARLLLRSWGDSRERQRALEHVGHLV